MSKDDENLKQHVLNGKSAEDILNAPVYKNAYLGVRADLLAQLEALPYNDSDAIVECKRRLTVCTWLERKMERAMRDGKVAEKTLLEKVKSKLRLAG